MISIKNSYIRYKIRKRNSTGLEQGVKEKKTGGELLVKHIIPIARQVASEGVVLLKNDNNVLPLRDEDIVTVFGRTSLDWFSVGYGSGGDIKSPYNINFIDGLKNNNVNLNERILHKYQKWTKNFINIPDQGYWGHWPMSYPEMKISEKEVERASNESNKAIVVIGRAAGEDRENLLKEGSYYLTKNEKELIRKVTKFFKSTIIVLDCGNIIDMSWINNYPNIEGIVYAWQGGMESGNAVAEILTGKTNPSGKLTDTITKSYEVLPSSSCFGNKDYNEYKEDIFVGYRYFETFAKDGVMYPFGYGLSYTTFDIEAVSKNDNTNVSIEVKVTNTGNMKGKEVVQVYLSAPQGKLGKAAKELVAFEKTKELMPNETQIIHINFNLDNFASYDDSGATGYKNSYILEAGEYKIFIGNNVRNNKIIHSFNLQTKLIKKVLPVLGLKSEYQFERIKNDNGKITYELVPISAINLKDRILSKLPKTIQPREDNGILLSDVKTGKCTIEEFVAQLSIEELNALTHGEGNMNSLLGTAGNAGAFGGFTDGLRKKGIPPIITTDGPSGIRLFKTCSLLPCGTAMASTFNNNLIEKLYEIVAEEMKIYDSDILLAPGMNIHRNPLCGRNFEYFSEDPYLTGIMGCAVVNGLQNKGVSGCPKHFACNNQEYNRCYNDSRVSERALREIYLKGFQIVVEKSQPNCIMTSYNKINGVWSHYNYDLVTTILRNEWGFKGVVMTDWGMREDVSEEFPNCANDAYRVRAQVDILMPGYLKLIKNVGDGNTIQKSLNLNEGITLGEVQCSTINVLNFILKTKF